MKTSLLAALAGASTLLIAACAPAAPPKVDVLDPWCRPTLPSAPTAACYLTLTPTTADRLTAVTTTASASAEIHTMSTEGGIMRMRPLEDGLDLPARQATALRPGAEHLMLIGPVAPLKEGDTVRLVLSFERAPQVTVEAVVRQAVGGGGHRP